MGMLVIVDRWDIFLVWILNKTTKYQGVWRSMITFWRYCIPYLPTRLWSKAVHYVGNTVPFGTQTEALSSAHTTSISPRPAGSYTTIHHTLNTRHKIVSELHSCWEFHNGSTSRPYFNINRVLTGIKIPIFPHRERGKQTLLMVTLPNKTGCSKEMEPT